MRRRVSSPGINAKRVGAKALTLRVTQIRGDFQYAQEGIRSVNRAGPAWMAGKSSHKEIRENSPGQKLVSSAILSWQRGFPVDEIIQDSWKDLIRRLQQ